MTPAWRGRILKVLLGVYLVIVGFVAGVVFERMRFDAERKAVLDRYNDVVHKARVRQMEIERESQRR